MVSQQVIRRLREAHFTELLEERDGAAALPGRGAPPDKAFLDADAVHLSRSVVAAGPLQRAAQGGRQVRVLDNVRRLFRETADCVCTQILTLSRRFGARS